MISSREDFLMTLLKCGSYDLSLIDGVEYDWCDIFNHDSVGMQDANFSLPAVMSAVFSFGKSQMEDAIQNRIGYLEDTEKTYGISEEQREELESLRCLEVYEDLEEFHNYIDTHVTCVRNKEIYQKHLQAELEAFADGTGYEVEF